MAIADREAIMEYIAADNPAAAIALDDLFEEKAELARQNPTIYKPGRMKGTREIVVKPNYVMVYSVSNEEQLLTIMTVKHAAQQWPEVEI